MDADVICLQEVDRYFGDRSEDVDQALLLSRALDMQLAWGPAIDEPARAGSDRPPRQYGNALLSRLPILISDVHRLPGGGRTAQRAADDAGARRRHAVGDQHPPEHRAGRRSGRSRWPRWRRCTPTRWRPASWSATSTPAPDAPELAPLHGRFADAWELADDRDDQAGWRFWQRDEGRTHPSHAPHRRIDQVWVSPGVTVAAAQVLDAEGASDHLPLMVDLEAGGV